MMHFLPANHLRLYRNFKAIDKEDFYGIVRFYEMYEDALQCLEIDIRFECMLVYTNALFELNQFGQHILMCDQCLVMMIENNLGNSGNNPLYRQILYDKAISLFYEEEIDQALHITKQLMKLDPEDPAFLRLHIKCSLQKKPRWLLRGRAVAMALILFSAAFSGVYFLIFRPFLPALAPLTLYAHYATLGASVALLIWVEALHLYRVNKKAKALR